MYVQTVKLYTCMSYCLRNLRTGSGSTDNCIIGNNRWPYTPGETNTQLKRSHTLTPTGSGDMDRNWFSEIRPFS